MNICNIRENSDESLLNLVQLKSKKDNIYTQFLKSKIGDSKISFYAQKLSYINIACLLSGVNNITVKDSSNLLEDNLLAKSILDVASVYMHKSFIVYTSSREDYALLKQRSNILPMFYGEKLYECVKYNTYDCFIMLPLKDVAYNDILLTCDNLIENLPHFDFRELDYIGLHFNIDDYDDEYRAHRNKKDGKIVIKDDNGEETMLEIK